MIEQGMCRHALTDEQWTRIEPLLPTRTDLEELPLDDIPEPEIPAVTHENVRGGVVFVLLAALLAFQFATA